MVLHDIDNQQAIIGIRENKNPACYVYNVSAISLLWKADWVHIVASFSLPEEDVSYEPAFPQPIVHLTSF